MTKAQELGITQFPFEILDANGNQISFRDSTGYWEKSEYDANGNQISFRDSNDYWSRNKVMKKILKGLFIFMIALTILWFGLIITYSFSSGESAGRIGDAIDLITPILFVLGAIGIVTNSED